LNSPSPPLSFIPSPPPIPGSLWTLSIKLKWSWFGLWVTHYTRFTWKEGLVYITAYKKDCIKKECFPTSLKATFISPSSVKIISPYFRAGLIIISYIMYFNSSFYSVIFCLTSWKRHSGHRKEGQNLYWYFWFCTFF
jgi:hypothetical protein